MKWPGEVTGRSRILALNGTVGFSGIFSAAMSVRARSRPLVLTCLAAFAGENIAAQRSEPDTMHALRTHERMILDGLLDEVCWQRAVHINNFTQRDPMQGEPGTDRTDVAVVYDSLALYVGVVLPVTDPEHMQAKYMQRDFAWWADDNFQFVISTFNDHRNGYLFVTNPNGARGDMQVSPNSGFNTDWNGVWDVVTSCTDIGWTAEFRIPFNTLQFPKADIHTWGINFERNVRSKNEQVNWQGWDRNTAIENLGNTGTLVGIHDIGYAKRFEFKPYALGGLQQAAGQKDDWPGKLGADLNVNVSPTLKLNLTANTDFAQVEADRIPVNLSRFSLFYPEKRAFFLEGQGNYQFDIDGNNRLYYTRRIGLENGAPVPVLGGARLFGKQGKHNIGALVLQTGATSDAPTTNNAVLRYKRDIGKQSFIGALMTSKINEDLSNQVFAIDGGWNSNEFLGNKRIALEGYYGRSMTDGRLDSSSTTAGIWFNYPNDRWNASALVGTTEGGFNPQLGFLNRTNYEVAQGYVNFEPRWFQKQGIRKVLFTLADVSLYRTAHTGYVESFSYGMKPLGVLLGKGDEAGLAFNWFEDGITEGFDIGDGITIAPGRYRYRETVLYVSTFGGRRFQFEPSVAWGTFFGGRKTTADVTMKANLDRHFNMQVDYTWNVLEFAASEDSPHARLETNELALYPTYAFNPNLSVSVFGQWNSLSDFTRINARLHWIPKIGTDLFLVFNQADSPAGRIDWARPASRNVVGKLVWRVMF